MVELNLNVIKGDPISFWLPWSIDHYLIFHLNISKEWKMQLTIHGDNISCERATSNRADHSLTDSLSYIYDQIYNSQ